ncbi:MAG: ATP-binding protein [Nitrospirota bacterium]
MFHRFSILYYTHRRRCCKPIDPPLSYAITGAGIPRDIVDNIFDPFFTTRTYRFGMGLPLVKQIVVEHLGEVEVESAAGKGTTFRLVFPVRWMEKSR